VALGDGRRVIRSATAWPGPGPAALFLHGWGLRPNAYRRPIQAMAGGGLPGLRPRPPGLRRDPRAGSRATAPSPATPLGRALRRRRGRVGGGGGGRALLRRRGGHRLHLPPTRRVSASPAGQRHRQPDLGTVPQRGPHHGATPVVGLGPALRDRPPALAGPDPVAAHAARGLHPQPDAEPVRHVPHRRVHPDGPTWCARCGPSPVGGSRSPWPGRTATGWCPDQPSTSSGGPPVSTGWWWKAPTPGSSPTRDASGSWPSAPWSTRASPTRARRVDPTPLLIAGWVRRR
jgi:hypothetical protein